MGGDTPTFRSVTRERAHRHKVINEGSTVNVKYRRYAYVQFTPTFWVYLQWDYDIISCSARVHQTW